jgi:hypothetical protein
MLTDEDLTGYDKGLFYDAVSAALDAILPWVPKTSTYELVGAGERIYALPDDCYEVETCVVQTTGEMLPKATISPGNRIGASIASVNDWLEYPHGYLSFSKNVLVGETYNLYYLAHWTKPTGDSNLSDFLEPPSFTHLGITLYSAAYMILPSAVSASEVRQFNTKVDSGNPEHNPMQQSATYLMRLFADEMNRHPKHQKAQR